MFILHAGKLEAGNLLYVTGAMWSPGLAAFATKKIFGENIRDLPWRWGTAPICLAGICHPDRLRAAGLSYRLAHRARRFQYGNLAESGRDFGWQNFPPALALLLFVLITATLGMVGKVSRALGEEIGWRGFLVPELSKVVGFPGIGLISGLMWAAYHYPVRFSQITMRARLPGTA